MPPGKFCKITPKNTNFCAFWKQVLDNTVFTFFFLSAGTHFEKITLNRLKIMVEKPWLAVFIVTCALGLAVVLHLFQNMCIVLFFAFVRCQQNRRQKIFNWGLYVCAGGLTSQNLTKIYWFIVLHISRIGGLFGGWAPVATGLASNRRLFQSLYYQTMPGGT